jgi:vacuolar-type H+-ATPase subunit D/Vma8
MTTSLDQIKTRVEDLSKRFKTVNSKKSNLGGLLQAKKDELAALKKEIEAAGLDPRKLKDKRDELQAEVVAMIDDFDKKLTRVEEAFAAFDSRK